MFGVSAARLASSAAATSDEEDQDRKEDGEEEEEEEEGGKRELCVHVVRMAHAAMSCVSTLCCMTCEAVMSVLPLEMVRERCIWLGAEDDCLLYVFACLCELQRCAASFSKLRAKESFKTAA